MKPRRLSPAVLALLLFAAPAFAYQSSPPRKEAPESKDFGPLAGSWRAGIAAMMPIDFGEQYLYAAANAALAPPAPGENRVVFLGDSITDLWDLAAYFPGKPYLNRGVGGQVTPQMLARFHADVVALKPAAIVILGGINDLGGALQVETAEQIEANYEAMAEIAGAHGIRPIFTAVLPVNNDIANTRFMIEERRPAEIEALNHWLAAYCAAHHFGLIDYGPALKDQRGLLRAEYTADGLHPNALAYAAMAPIAEKAIEEALGSVRSAR